MGLDVADALRRDPGVLEGGGDRRAWPLTLGAV